MYKKIYFWILVTFFLIGFWGARNLLEISSTTINILNYISGTLFFVGVAGYIWKKKIFNEVFWKIFFPLYIIGSFVLAYTQHITMSIIVDHDATASLVGIIISIVFLIPGVVFLYYYAFKSKEIWDNKNTI